MTISETSISIAHILVWFNSMNTRTSVNIALTLVRLNSINRDNGSRAVYLLIVERDNVTMSLMNGGGTFLLKMLRVCWLWRQRPSAAIRKWAVMEVGSSRAKSASRKPYSSSPGAGSKGRGFRRPALQNAGARRRSKWRDYGGSVVARRGKIQIGYLRIFQLELPIVVFVVYLPQVDWYIYIGTRIPYPISTSNMLLINVVPFTSTHGFNH
jgi:hypothetical protein